MDRLCQNAGCSKKATLQCPKCIQLQLPPSHFCSQDCFKAAWPTHKHIHTLAAGITDGKSKMPPEFAGFKFTGTLRPGLVSPRRVVPDHIQKPDYYFAPDGEPKGEREAKSSALVEVKTPEQIEKMRKVCKIGREILDIAAKAIAVGVTGDEIDRIVHEASIERNCYPSTLNYRGFPKSLCTSVNEVICHGIPDSRPLEDGDILNLDISCYYDGVHTDLNATYLVGNVDEKGRELVNTSREALDKAIAICKPGTLYREVGNVISKFVQQRGYSVVRSVCGHGIGSLFHTTPSVPHYASMYSDFRVLVITNCYQENKAVGMMKPGHVFTIEPMINEGNWRDIMWPDQWTIVTADGSRSAQFEHTILITETGCEVLTA